MFELYKEIFMSEEKDYEAIGRYHTAKERLEKLIQMRSNAAASIKEKIAVIDHANIHSGFVRKFDSKRAVELLDEIATLTNEIEITVNEVNRYASAAGSRPLDLK